VEHLRPSLFIAFKLEKDPFSKLGIMSLTFDKLTNANVAHKRLIAVSAAVESGGEKIRFNDIN
jgi:hypothetical protein